MYFTLFLAAIGAAPSLGSALYIRDDPAPSGGIPTDSFTILANHDGNCQKGLTGDGDKSFNLKGHDLKSPLSINSPTFPGAENQGGGGNPTGQGYDVFFSMGDPPAGCKNIIMVPWRQPTPPPDSTPGMQVVQASKRGCYYAHIPAATTLTMSQCCGDDCKNASLDQDEPNEAGKDAPLPTKKRALDSRWTYEGLPAPGAKCSFADLKATNSRAGPQRKITNGVGGGTLPTAWTFTQAISFGMTSTSSTTQTITTSDGSKVGVTAGASFFGVTASVTAEASQEWSNAVATASGKDTSIGNSSQISVALSEPAGTDNVFVSFVPKFICYDGPSKCSNDTSTPWHNCFPAYLPDGKTLDGDYGFVTVA